MVSGAGTALAKPVVLSKLGEAPTNGGPRPMEAFSTHGNGTLTVVKERTPTEFEVEQNLQTMDGGGEAPQMRGVG
jgi:hypothetical protein